MFISMVASLCHFVISCFLSFRLALWRGEKTKSRQAKRRNTEKSQVKKYTKTQNNARWKDEIMKFTTQNEKDKPKNAMRNIALFMSIKWFCSPSLGNFADISYLKENFKLRLLRGVYTLYAGALACNSVLHMLL